MESFQSKNTNCRRNKFYFITSLILYFVYFLLVSCNYVGYFDPQLGPEQRCSCGIANHPNQRIVGGEATAPNEFPWIVALYNAFGMHFCGGSLISDRYVLTAAHCVEFKDSLGVIVALGEYNMSEYSSRVRKIGVKKIIIHPRYISLTYSNDIALLEMQEAIIFDDSKRPACFPRPGIDYTDKTVTVAGWGITMEEGSPSDVLRKVSLIVISMKRCKLAYGRNIVMSTVICAGWLKGGRDSCEGDSGGPLMIEAGSRWQLIGIVSSGFGCARPGYPAYYTRVDRYYEWIDKNTKNSHYCND